MSFKDGKIQGLDTEVFPRPIRLEVIICEFWKLKFFDSFFEFLAKFYNIKNENKNSFFTINQEEFISYSDFADLVYPYLEPYLYVKF